MEVNKTASFSKSKALLLGAVVGIIFSFSAFDSNPEGYRFRFGRYFPYLIGIAPPVMVAFYAFATDKFQSYTSKKRVILTICVLVGTLMPYLIWRYGWQLMFVIMFFLIGGFWLAVIYGAKKSKESLDERNRQRKFEAQKAEIIESHGVKGWATTSQVDARLAGGSGSGVNVVGWLNQTMKFKGHVMTCGYARSGKGVNLITHALLTPHLGAPSAPSFVVLDPKGENVAISGRFLERMGYNVMVIDPFDIPEVRGFQKVRFNPFDQFDANSPYFTKHVDLIKDAINPPQASKHANSFFTDAASELIALHISHMMSQNEEPKDIKTLYRWLRLGGTDRIELLKSMARNPHFDIADESKSIIQQLLEGGKSITDVYANAAVATAAFKDEGIRWSMSGSDFNISDIPNRKTALFICLSPEDMQRMGAWLRLIMASIMRGFTRHYNPDRKVVMLMDEFPTMGYLKEFEIGMGFIAGYNITLWPIIQDLNQLRNLYPNVWETFVGNAAVKHWMVRDNFTAEYLSKQMPNDLVFLGKNPDGSPRYKEKPLMTPAEIMQCEDIILQIDGMGSVYLMTKLPYYLDSIASQNASPNPFHR